VCFDWSDEHLHELTIRGIDYSSDWIVDAVRSRDVVLDAFGLRTASVSHGAATSGRAGSSIYGSKPSRLFVGHDHAPLNQQFVDGLLRRLCAAADVTPPQAAMAHALRHSYGMRLALRGVPLPVIQQLLGHTDPRTSAIYTAAHATDLTHALHDAGLP
jgi:integrase